MDHYLADELKDRRLIKDGLKSVERNIKFINDRIIELIPERSIINGESHSETMGSSIVNASVQPEEEKLLQSVSEPVTLSGKRVEPEKESESVSVASLSSIDEPRSIKRKLTKKNFAPLMARNIGRKRALTEEVASSQRDPDEQLLQAVKSWLQH